LGRWLFRRALADRPIKLAAAPRETAEVPDITFIIGHRGKERAPLLELTLMSIAAQQGAFVEAVVIEQPAGTSELTLPLWVRHLVTRTPEGTPYNRAWAFNVGAAAARGQVLVLHDGDMLVPREYARCVMDHVQAGHEVVDLKRFIFYLSESHTRELCRSKRLPERVPIKIVQNARGGGSMAITTEAYARLGAMDEGFMGWGGEDSEFWERCTLLKVWDYGYLPTVHLWHPDQPRKEQPENPTMSRYSRLAGIAPIDRVRRLASAPRGGAAPRREDPFADVLDGSPS
jgi:hypothetical protein